MKRYIIRRRNIEIDEWTIEAENDNEAADKFQKFQRKIIESLRGGDYTGGEMFREKIEWAIFKESDIKPGIKKFLLTEKK